ncbi:MAG: hypothetical protein A3J52_02125 [Omnitrophica bacterium RIFCSPHIGHO2_02_FULL_49_9]|nr:MAG: hypothetical protein A3J52_02125 [Omnitrophica bacterium RIFCSPHIGHO2_02_FULL_49_9]OGW88750.1 MAG: hypothetical protein A3A73_00185 [Omnitrophica bacterium RIFCSPLOWO2_01_FULL_50_24]
MTRILRSYRTLSKLGERLRRQGKRIVFTNGCFDILHAGHVAYLNRARAYGSVLVVGLNSDRSVRSIKGRGRPLNSELDRARVLSALASVDYVAIFDEETPVKLIRAIRPHVLVKGADWSKQKIAGGKDVLSWGGEIKRVRLLKGRSTSRLIQKARRAS